MIFGNREHPYHDTLVGHVDSDFAGCKDSSKSTTGSIFLVYGAGLIEKLTLPHSWFCKKTANNIGIY